MSEWITNRLPRTWQALAEIECDLIRAYDAATDAEGM